MIVLLFMSGSEQDVYHCQYRENKGLHEAHEGTQKKHWYSSNFEQFSQNMKNHVIRGNIPI
jgi:hypothetical protein